MHLSPTHAHAGFADMTLAALSPFRSGSHADHVAFAHQVKSRNFLRKCHLVAIGAVRHAAGQLFREVKKFELKETTREVECREFIYYLRIVKTAH